MQAESDRRAIANTPVPMIEAASAAVRTLADIAMFRDWTPSRCNGLLCTAAL
jgi:hypothetical protein